MPGYDGTGPRGMGPMSGRARGYCAVPGGGRGLGTGFGMGRGIRGRRAFGGFGRGWGLGYRAGPAVEPIAPQDELGSLRREADALEAELAQIRGRIDELS